MSPRPQPRLPLEPLVAAHGSVSALARTLGRSRAQVSKWRATGVPLLTADRVACALGRHPAEVWPQWWSLDVDDEAA
jgi:hypothetical protein